MPELSEQELISALTMIRGALGLRVDGLLNPNEILDAIGKLRYMTGDGTIIVDSEDYKKKLALYQFELDGVKNMGVEELRTLVATKAVAGFELAARVVQQAKELEKCTCHRTEISRT